jgi:hypothetical protein
LFLLLERFLFFDKVPDSLVLSKKKGFDLYLWSFDPSFNPVDVGFESSSPGKTKDKSVFSQVSDIEPLSFFFIPQGDHQVACVSDGSMSINGSIHIEDDSGLLQFLGPQAESYDSGMVDKIFCCSAV